MINVAILPPKELMSDSGEYYRITCRFCDTHLTVVHDQAGTEIKCPDCFSMLTVGPPPKKSKSKSAGRGGRSWRSDEDSSELRLAESEEATPTGQDDSDSDGGLRLSDTFERPVVSPLFGLEASEENLLAPRKRKPPVEASDPSDDEIDERSSAGPEKRPSTTQKSGPTKNASPSDIDMTESEDAFPAIANSQPNLDEPLNVDLPLPEDEVLSLDAIGKLDPDSELKARASQPSSEQKPIAAAKRRVKKQPTMKSSQSEEIEARRPEFKYANLFMATVSMLMDFKVLSASGVAVLVMLFGGISSEVIFPVGTNTEEMTMTASMSKYFISFLFGNLPYYFGLLGLWAVAGIVFQHAAQGHVKVQHWIKAGQSELWSSFLLFGFSFFIAGLPGAILHLLIIPLRMLVAPLFLISAWFNFSPWQIVSTDWYHSINENKSQWITVYSCFGGLAFAGLLTGVVFMVRIKSELMAVDLILTFIGVVSNAIITLVFAAIAGWHTGAVLDSLDQDH